MDRNQSSLFFSCACRITKGGGAFSCEFFVLVVLFFVVIINIIINDINNNNTQRGATFTFFFNDVEADLPRALIIRNAVAASPTAIKEPAT